MTKFEDTGFLHLGGDGNLLLSETEEVIALAVEEVTMESTYGTYNVCAVTRRMLLSWNPMSKTVYKMLQFYPYKIKHVHELQRNDSTGKESFDLEFLPRMEMDDHWLWNIL